MKISELLSKKKPMLSFEVFPPKTEENYESIKSAAEKIAKLKPAFMSVTYGAGGGTGKYTLSLSEELMKNSGITPLSHLTCVSSTKEMINNQLTALKNAGIENILALRGDIPNDMLREGLDFKYACELIEQIRSFGGFCIGGACYPEGHTESVNQKADIAALKIKAEAGCEFFTSQMFFDKNIFPIENMTADKYTRKCADSSVCHIFEKILKLKDLMMTESGKQEAQERHQIIVDVLYHLFKEENAPEWTEYLNNYLKVSK